MRGAFVLLVIALVIKAPFYDIVSHLNVRKHISKLLFLLNGFKLSTHPRLYFFFQKITEIALHL